MRTTILLCAGLLLASGAGARAATYRVPADVEHIQRALDSCATGDTVLVASGTYAVNLLWPAKEGIKLLSEAGAEATILDGGARDQVLGIYTGVDSTTVVRGFTITNGIAGGM